MDFKDRRYFLIGRFMDYSFNNCEINKLKRYFSCKAHCNYYYYNNACYRYCVSINSRNSKRMLNYLKDKKIEYKEVNTTPMSIAHYRKLFVDNSLSRIDPYLYRRMQESDRKIVDEILSRNKKDWRTPAMKLLDELTK